MRVTSISNVMTIIGPVLLLLLHSLSGFTTTIPARTTTTRPLFEKKEDNRNFLEKLDPNFFGKRDPLPSTVPQSIRDEIYKAEGNTEAANNRATRLALYISFALLFTAVGIFNTAFSSGVMIQMTEEGKTYEELGYGFIEYNAFTKFLFTDVICKVLELAIGTTFALLADAEIEGKNKNIQQIYEEYDRRKVFSYNREQTREMSKNAPPSQRKRMKKEKKKKNRQQKRLDALSEIVDEEEVTTTMMTMTEQAEVPSTTAATTNDDNKSSTEDDSFLGKMKGWYEKADSMAASQALLLNKELEDKGVLDKITDESGLKVVGKDAAAKLQEEKEKNKNSVNND